MWALASVLFRQLGTAITPLTLNLYKGVIASAMLAVTILVLETPWEHWNIEPVAILMASGAVGIGIGDTAFFTALNQMGERRTVLMVETLAPMLTVIMAFAALGETIHDAELFGVGIILAGVALVIYEPVTVGPKPGRSGIFEGVLAAVCQAAGAIMSRAILIQTDIAPLWSTLFRLLGGIGFLLFWIIISGRPLSIGSSASARDYTLILLATLLGTYLGIFLQQVAFKLTQVGIAQTLIATSALFVLPIVAMRGERISLRACCGAVTAFSGIALLLAL